MNIPEELLYSQDHEWVKIEGDTATCGITDFAQGELGDIVFVEIDKIGEKLNSGDTFGTIEAVKTVSELFMPLAGEILEMNSQLEGTPELINQEAYGNGWIIKVNCGSSPDTSHLMNAAAYKESLNSQ